MNKKQCITCNKSLETKKFRSYSTKSGIKYCKECEKCRNKQYAERINTKKRTNYDPTKKHVYYLKNKESIKARTSKCHIERRRVDPLYKLVDTIRYRTNTGLKRRSWRKTTGFYKYIGCTLDELKTHLENQFKPGMTWDNHGKWHIDHIIPLASAKTEDELYKLCHYLNLQPLWAEENKKKGAKILAPI